MNATPRTWPARNEDPGSGRPRAILTLPKTRPRSPPPLAAHVTCGPRAGPLFGAPALRHASLVLSLRPYPAAGPPPQQSCQSATLSQKPRRRFRQVGVSGTQLPRRRHLPFVLPAPRGGCWGFRPGYWPELLVSEVHEVHETASSNSGETPFNPPGGGGLFACSS